LGLEGGGGGDRGRRWSGASACCHELKELAKVETGERRAAGRARAGVGMRVRVSGARLVVAPKLCCSVENAGHVRRRQMRAKAGEEKVEIGERHPTAARGIKRAEGGAERSERREAERRRKRLAVDSVGDRRWQRYLRSA